MIVKCMKKEIKDDNKIKVSLETPYERDMVTKGNVTFVGTEEETKHIIVGREYEVNLNEIVVENSTPKEGSILIKDKYIPLSYECILIPSERFIGSVAIFTSQDANLSDEIRIDIWRNDLALMKTIKDNFKVTESAF